MMPFEIGHVPQISSWEAPKGDTGAMPSLLFALLVREGIGLTFAWSDCQPPDAGPTVLVPQVTCGTRPLDLNEGHPLLPRDVPTWPIASFPYASSKVKEKGSLSGL